MEEAEDLPNLDGHVRPVAKRRPRIEPGRYTIRIEEIVRKQMPSDGVWVCFVNFAVLTSDNPLVLEGSQFAYSMAENHAYFRRNVRSLLCALLGGDPTNERHVNHPKVGAAYADAVRGRFNGQDLRVWVRERTGRTSGQTYLLYQWSSV